MSSYPASPKLAMYHSQPKPKRHSVLVSRRSLLGFAIVLLVIYTLTQKAGSSSSRQASAPAGEYNRAVDTGAAKAAHPASPQHDAVVDRLAGQAVVAGAGVGQGKRPLEFGRPGDIAPANPAAVAAAVAANKAGTGQRPIPDATDDDLSLKPRPAKLPPPPRPKKAAGGGVPPPPPPGPTPGEQQVHEDLSGAADAPKPPPKGGAGKNRPLVKPAPDIPPPAPKPVLPPLAKDGRPAVAPKKAGDNPPMRAPPGYKALEKAEKAAGRVADAAAAAAAGAGVGVGVGGGGKAKGVVKAGAKEIAAEDDKASEYAGHEELEDVEVDVEAAVEEEEELQEAEEALDEDVVDVPDDDVSLDEDAKVKAAVAAALPDKDDDEPSSPHKARPASQDASDTFKVDAKLAQPAAAAVPANAPSKPRPKPLPAKVPQPNRLANANANDNGNGVAIPPAPTNDPYDRVGEGDAAWGGLDAGKVPTEPVLEEGAGSTGEKVVQAVKEGAKELVGVGKEAAARGKAVVGEGRRVPMGLGAKKVGAWEDN